MTDKKELAERLREQAEEFLASSERLFKLADEIDPPSDKELLERDMKADDEAMWNLFIRVYNVVKDNPGITVTQIAAGMGLPGNYPSPNANHFTQQILHWLMNMGLVYVSTRKKPYGWTASAGDCKQPPNLRLVVG